MKKLIALLLALVMVLSLVACAAKQGENDLLQHMREPHGQGPLLHM